MGVKGTPRRVIMPDSPAHTFHKQEALFGFQGRAVEHENNGSWRAAPKKCGPAVSD